MRVNDQTGSPYARYESILNKAKPVYTNHGFALSFGTDSSPLESHIRITCSVTHEKGHSKDFFVDLPMDSTGIKGNVNKTQIHGTGSTYSYGKRYLITMIFNIEIANEDDDGVKAGKREHDKMVKQPVIDFFMKFTDAINRNFFELAEFKSQMDEENYEVAAGIWYDFSEDDQHTLHLAPSKGGILTTKQREIMKSSEFTTRK